MMSPHFFLASPTLRTPSSASLGGSQRGAPLWQASLQSARDNVKFFWEADLRRDPRGEARKAGLNYSSAVTDPHKEINTRWVSCKWGLVSAGPGFFELGVKGVSKSKSSRAPTTSGAPFEQNRKQKIHFFCSFIAAFYVCYAALWVGQPLRDDETWSPPKCVGVPHVLACDTVAASLRRVPVGACAEGGEQTGATRCSSVHRKHCVRHTARHVFFCLPSVLAEAAFPPSSVGCINNSCIFCILSALYIFILWVRQHDVWE